MTQSSREVFRSSIATVCGQIVVCLFVSLLGFAFVGGPLYLALRPGGEVTVLTFLGPPLGALCLLLGFFLAFFTVPSTVRFRIFFCSQGIAHNRAGKIESCRWDDVYHVVEEIQQTFPRPSGSKYIVLRKDGQQLVFTKGDVSNFKKFGRVIRAEATRRGIPCQTNVYYPVARICPRCGSPSFTRVRETVGLPIFGNKQERTLKQCNECGTRYTSPMQVSTIVLLLVLGCLFISGGLLTIVAVSTLYTSSDPEHRLIPSSLFFVLGGIPFLIFGIYGLRKRSSMNDSL